MIKRIVTVKPRGGKLVEARQWAQEILEFARKKYPKNSPEVYFEKYGDVNRMYWMGQYESIDELEKVAAENQSDNKFLEIYMKGIELFVDGSNKVILLASL